MKFKFVTIALVAVTLIASMLPDDRRYDRESNWSRARIGFVPQKLQARKCRISRPHVLVV